MPELSGREAGLPIPLDREGEKWTREKLVIAFSLYNEIPFV